MYNCVCFNPLASFRQCVTERGVGTTSIRESNKPVVVVVIMHFGDMDGVVCVVATIGVEN